MTVMEFMIYLGIGLFFIFITVCYYVFTADYKSIAYWEGYHNAKGKCPYAENTSDYSDWHRGRLDYFRGE